MAKPCTSDQAAAMSAAWGSVSFSSTSSLAAGTDGPREHAAGGFHGRAQGWSAHVEALAAEHQQEEAGIGAREGDVAAADGGHALGRRIAVADIGLHVGDEPLEAHGGELAQQARQVAEVVLGGGMRYAGLAGCRPQGETLDALALQDALGGLQHRLLERAVMVGGRAPGLAHPARRLCVRAPGPRRFRLHLHRPLRHVDAVNIWLDGAWALGHAVC